MLGGSVVVVVEVVVVEVVVEVVVVEVVVVEVVVVGVVVVITSSSRHSIRTGLFLLQLPSSPSVYT